MAVMLCFVSVVAPVGAQETSGRQTIDLELLSITVGNASKELAQWTQGDNSLATIAERGETYGIRISSKLLTGPDEVDATVTLEVVHPLGVVAETHTRQIRFAGVGQAIYQDIQWTPEAAHSILSADGLVTGGWTLRATVSASGESFDDRLNNVKERLVAVAIGLSDIDALSSVEPHEAYMANYNPNTGEEGNWKSESTTVRDGTNAWRHSPGPDQTYVSFADDWLAFGWLLEVQRSCGSEDDEHPQFGTGIGFGQLPGVNAQYCKLWFDSSRFTSIQLAGWTIGSVDPSDQVGFYVDYFGETAYHNFSASDGAWSMETWDLTNVLKNYQYEIGYRFKSDSSASTTGMVVDGFYMFGIERVPYFTVDLTCNGENSGYSLSPDDITRVHCQLMTNAYEDKDLRIVSMVESYHSRTSSIAFNNQMRIEVADSPSTSGNIPLDRIEPQEVLHFNVTMTVPASSPAQEGVWSIWINESVLGGDNKASINYPITVEETLVPRLRADVSTGPSSGLRISGLPGQTIDRVYHIENVGNADGEFTVSHKFSNSTWELGGDVEFRTENGNSTLGQPMLLNRTEDFLFSARISLPADAAPGEHRLTLYAQDVDRQGDRVSLPIDIEVPHANKGPDGIWREGGVRAEVSYNTEQGKSAPANGETFEIEWQIKNLGNDIEVFNLITTDELIGANAPDGAPVIRTELSRSETSPITPQGIELITATYTIPSGVPSGTYNLNLAASPTLISGQAGLDTYLLTVSETRKVSIETSSDFDQVHFFSSSKDSDSEDWLFKVTNLGNTRDTIEVIPETPDGIKATIMLPTDGLLTLDEGISGDVIIRIKVNEGVAEGQYTLSLIARSRSDPMANAEILAPINVGNHLKLLDVRAPLQNVITAPDTWIKLSFTISNADAQDISLADISWDSDDGNLDFAEPHSIRETRNDALVEPGLTERWVLYVKIPQQKWDRLEGDPQASDVVLRIATRVGNVVVNASVTYTGPTDETAESELAGEAEPIVSGAAVWAGVQWVVMTIIVLVLVVILVGVLKSGEEEDDYGSLVDYSPAADSSYSVDAAPDVSAIEAAAPAETAAPESKGPPVPDSGLPDGWTMDQWEHYGEQWLEQGGDV